MGPLVSAEDGDKATEQNKDRSVRGCRLEAGFPSLSAAASGIKFQAFTLFLSGHETRGFLLPWRKLRVPRKQTPDAGVCKSKGKGTMSHSKMVF